MSPGASEPFYDSVMDDYEDEDEAGASSGAKRRGASLGLKLRSWDFGVRPAKSEVSLIDFTDDSFSSNTPSPLTESRQPDQDTLKVQLSTAQRFHAHTPNLALRTAGRAIHPGLAPPTAGVRRSGCGAGGAVGGPGGAFYLQGSDGDGRSRVHMWRRHGVSQRVPVS